MEQGFTMKTNILYIFSLCFFLQGPLFAEPLEINPCTTQVLNQTHLKHSVLSAQIDALFLESLSDPYELTMPLMVAGLSGDNALYTVISAHMNKSFKVLEENSFKDWLTGRILLADFALHGKVTRTDLLITLQRHADLNPAHDNFMTWAIGYLAAVDYSYKDKMLNAASALTDNASVSQSDKLWAWVLALQAAAQAQDNGTYLHSMEQITKIANKPDVAQALSAGLLRTTDSSDYPAWAIAIARLASATIGDSIYFDSLEKAMNSSLDAARRDAPKDYKARAEKLLAQVNNHLAIERNKALQACKEPITTNPEACAH